MGKHIAIDVDQTLCNTEKCFKEILQQEIDKYGYEDYFLNHYRHSEVEKQAMTTAEPFVGVAEFTHYLQEKGYKITILTARNNYLAEITSTWLNLHEIKFDKIIHCNDKSTYCAKNNIDSIIDDSAGHCLYSINEGLAAYSPNYKGMDKDIVGFENWEELKQYF